MIRKLLATTAIATLVATGASFAQTAPAPTAPVEQAAPQVIHADGHLASDLLGQTVYSSAGDDGQNIGSISDIVLSPEGTAQAVVIGVGGFLGLGKKDVAIEYDLIQWTERDGSRYLIVETTPEALKALPDFDVAAYRPMPADAQIGNTTPATSTDLDAAKQAADAEAAVDAANDNATGAMPDTAADTTTDTTDGATDMTAQNEPAATPPAAAPATDETRTSAIDRSTMTEVPVAEIRADDLIGTTVYGAGDENVGSIADVILSADGQVDAVTVDVGGFLGIGAKEVALDFDNLAFMRDGDGDTHLYTPLTKEQLEAQPEYDAATFADSRDQQLIVIPR
ncbi:MAG: PRC-barrel domain-containing protein [Aquamicrobium sp.]|uniref:PRC-barrel domain-containing protein n=1 Tax=Aquamicrobium sp. TaxID=1872579 RepID=UPI00349EB243|nr:PRC-barrel domain-containing protein [Aquamicrobium sp.]